MLPIGFLQTERMKIDQSFATLRNMLRKYISQLSHVSRLTCMQKKLYGVLVFQWLFQIYDCRNLFQQEIPMIRTLFYLCRWVDPMEGYQEPTLYEPRFGLPIVRKRLTYAQLLKEIRQGKVKEVSYFDCNDAPGENDKYRMKNITMEGYCLVRYQDDFVAQVILSWFSRVTPCTEFCVHQIFGVS